MTFPKPSERGWGRTRYYITRAIAERYPWVYAICGADRYDFIAFSRNDETVSGFTRYSERSSSTWSRAAIGHREIRSNLSDRHLTVWEHVPHGYGEVARMKRIGTVDVPNYQGGDKLWISRVVDSVAAAIDGDALRPVDAEAFDAQLRQDERRGDIRAWMPEWPFKGEPLDLGFVLRGGGR